jgi:catechol 2,3-dioxygenase-like lactoylglutathione lyase family enzyme
MRRIIFPLLLAITFNSSMKTMAQSEFSGNQIGVGVVVTDLEKSLDFYLNVIGMTKVDEFEVDKEFARASGLSDGIPFHVDVLKLEDSPDGSQWKLMSFGKEAGHSRPGHIQDDTGMQYITIMVKRLEPFLERIRKHGVKLLGDTPIELGDQHFVLVQDPDGTFIELIGPMEQE